jgi:hypothetical protein
MKNLTIALLFAATTTAFYLLDGPTEMDAIQATADSVMDLEQRK